jgi:hypothetical protein
MKTKKMNCIIKKRQLHEQYIKYISTIKMAVDICLLQANLHSLAAT